MNQKQAKLFVISASAMLASSTYLFSVSIGLPYIFIMTASILCLSILIPYRIKYNDRSVIYSIVLSLTMAVFLDLFFPMDRNKFRLVGEILLINISAPFLIYFCALIIFFEFTPHIPGLVSAISLIILLMTADVLKGGDTVSKLPLFSFAPRTLDKLFFAIIIIQIVLLTAVISFAKPPPIRKLKLKISFAKFAIIFLALAVSGTLLLASMRFHGVFERNVRKIEDFFFRYGIRRTRRGASYMSSATIDLRSPMREQLAESKDKIILRASSKNPPGYLRGRVFDFYSGGNWLPAQKEDKKLGSKSYEGILVYKTFFTGARAMQYPEKIEFLYSGDFKTDTLLVPGNYEQIELIAERLAWTKNGVLIPEEWDKDGGYTVYMKSADPLAAHQSPVPAFQEEFSNYLIVPESIYELLDEEIQKIFTGKDPAPLTDIEKIYELRNYFLSNYEYSLDFTMRHEDRDPLESFFRRKRGHCELFASSAVLIARRMGIPARYVTGFLCFEQNPIGGYYVSRIENAHAWAEIYLKDDKRWTLLEATPEDGIPRLSERDWSFFTSYSDYFYKSLQSVLSDVRRGFFAKAVLTFLTSIYEVLREIVWHPLRGPLLAIAFFLAVFLRIIVTRRRLKFYWKITENVFKLCEEFKAFEKTLASATKMERGKSSTIGEWFAKIAYRFPEISEELNSFSEAYHIYRFGNNNAPGEAEIRRIKKLRKSFPHAKIKKNLKAHPRA